MYLNFLEFISIIFVNYRTIIIFNIYISNYNNLILFAFFFVKKIDYFLERILSLSFLIHYNFYYHQYIR